MTDERAPGGDLVGESEREGEVDVEVDDPPGLVFEMPPGDLDRGDSGHDEKAEANGCGEKVGVGGEEDPELAECSHLRQLGIAERDEHDMSRDEPERPRSDAAVPTDEPILADRSLEPGQTGDEHHHDQHQVGPGESGESAPSDEPTTRGGERTACLSGDDETERDAKAETSECCQRVGNPTPGCVAGPRPRHLYAVYYRLLAGGSDPSDTRHVAILNGRNVSDHCLCCELTVSARSLPS